METFHFALNPGAYLFLGNSESVDGAGGDMYVTLDRDHCIFQSRAMRTKPILPLPELNPHPVFPEFPERTPQINQSLLSGRMSVPNLHQHLLELYAPPSVLVTGEYEIMHMSESVGRYLQLSGGEPSLSLLRIVKPELRLELRGAMYSASQKGLTVQVNSLPVRIADKDELVNIIVRPVVGEPEAARGLYDGAFPGGRRRCAKRTGH